MSKRTRVILLIAFTGGLLLVNYALSGRITIPTGDAAIWFHAGLLMLVIGAYWIEHFFTKPADVVINGLVAFVSVSTLTSPPFPEWWSGLRIFSLLLSFTAFLLVWSGDSALPLSKTSYAKRLLYNVVVRLGSATVLFSAIFILALVSYFDVHQPAVRWAVIFWGIILVARHLDLDGLARVLWRKTSKSPTVLGQVSRLAEPNIVRFQLLPDQCCNKGTLVTFTEGGRPTGADPLGVVIGQRVTPGFIETEAILLNAHSQEGLLNHRNTVCALGMEKGPGLDPLPDYADARLEHLIGFASPRTDISRLYFELVKKPSMEEGQLVAVPLQNGSRELLFQIVNAKLIEETTLEGSERAFTIAEAEQLGTWSVERQGFETYSWVVPENAEVFHVTEASTIERVDREHLVQVGTVPNSSLSVNINVRDLVLYHSAVLGVTGSGKSFLAYQLIEECAATGVKVLCLDISGDYRRYIGNAVIIRRSADVDAFLNSAESIGIVEFADDRTHPITATNVIANQALKWCREHRTQQEIKEPVPKVLLVLEEAHSLVPEWNSNPERSLQDTVNKTSQVALQARKYGLGFMVVTQRTANVTKSILNQCNTIFAFQAYDETGFEFMKNYMGVHYVEALPNLKKRQGVVVGKASVSDRPVIVRFLDQVREPIDEAPRELHRDDRVAITAQPAAEPTPAAVGTTPQ